MNVLKGNIAEVRVNGELSIVRVDVKDHLLSCIVIDTPQTVDYLVYGCEVKVIFKETEVIIATGKTEGISLRNKFKGKVVRIDSDILLSKLTIDTPVGKITSIITSNAVQELGVKIGSEVTAMIKTNELILSK
ncbi:MAG: TOBE domain-containing protein [Lutimonas sp.]